DGLLRRRLRGLLPLPTRETMSEPTFPPMQGPVCPLPLSQHDQIVIGHGSGGLMTHELIRDLFQKHLGNPTLNASNDAAIIAASEEMPAGSLLVVSTDAHIVSPLFFPGGDIGRLAICGTVNDVAMMGAQPRYLTATFILEEGFSIAALEEVLRSMQAACAEAGVSIIAADTKVTEKGKSDGLFISTTGIGWLPEGRRIAGDNAQPGDAVLVSGPMGNHGIAVMQARGNLGFQSEVRSDTAPLNALVWGLCQAFPSVHVLRDPTRGGLATTLAEIAAQSQVNITLEEAAIPIDQPVRKACELLGLDPLYLANEGKMIVILPEDDANAALSYLHTQRYGEDAQLIGKVSAIPAGQVWLRTPLGTTRVLEMLAGEMLPRIC
ncbi:MAG TPA: hydrogenase expression/formation protein HypE, partial [Anaerolineaceae bacterium]|nr:hydrogenase expression/formation protein HypE [Anaerolineaceae bacterium]